MNIERLTEVRAIMAIAPAGLINMADYGNPACGTPGCIAGWTCTLAGVDLDLGMHAASLNAREFLGLNRKTARHLFLDFLDVDSLDDLRITQAETLAAIDSLIAGAVLPTWPARVENAIKADAELWG